MTIPLAEFKDNLDNLIEEQARFVFAPNIMGVMIDCKDYDTYSLVHGILRTESSYRNSISVWGCRVQVSTPYCRILFCCTRPIMLDPLDQPGWPEWVLNPESGELVALFDWEITE